MKTTLFFISFLVWNFLNSQVNIGGIINFYLKPISYDPCSKTAIVTSTSNVTQNDYILIVQIQGAIINQSNNNNYGDILSFEKAGLFEIAQVSSVANNTITFYNSLVNTYDFDSKVQFVVCPYYLNVNITSDLIAEPWNGSTGGIIFLCANYINLMADIDASEMGFRGGITSNNYYSASDCSTLSYITSNYLGANKGESISINNSYGRGKSANGGGGGNNLNAGGGGGSNGGFGGKGGNQWTGCGLSSNGGLGGLALESNYRIFLGGGGGGGHQNNSEATIGGNGGGIIVLKSNTFVTNDFVVKSNGQDVAIDAGIDAAGGGGGGGTILFQSNSLSGDLLLEAKGGKGGDTDNGYTGGNSGGQCHGTGGGGGGGRIVLNIQNIGGILQNNISGGISGVNINNQSDCYNQSFGSENGELGIVIYNQIIPEDIDSNEVIKYHEESLYIPNCFTPNDDKINSYWFVQASCVLKYECLILNRWGNHLTTLNEIYEKWDGTFNGVNVPDGLYFYKINITFLSGKSNEYHGHISLIR